MNNWEYFEYLKPENDFAFGVIIFQFVLFFYWLGAAIYKFVQMRGRQTELKNCSNVERLRKLVYLRYDDDNLLAKTKAEADGEFQMFCQDAKLAKKSPIRKHLQLIFDAGWNASQLDPAGLLKATNGELFRVNSFLRSILSLFIILGLLGTLFGLASSLAQLAPISFGTLQTSGGEIGKSLENLLKQLKSAFAPSIWGVFFTILGVFFLAIYNNSSLKLRHALERETLTNWIPALLPTPTQNLRELSEQQLQASAEVAKFAADIRNEAGTLQANAKAANESFVQLNQFTASLVEFGQQFANSVDKIKPFQESLEQLHRQMVNDSAEFQKNVRDSLAKSEEFQKGIAGLLFKQKDELDLIHQNLVDANKSLKIYEESYIESRKDIDDKLQKVLDEAQKAFHNLSERNTEITETLVESVGEPLKSEVSERLSGIETALTIQLTQVGEKFTVLHHPFEQAADQLTRTYSNFNKRSEEISKELQQEFLRQNRENEEKLHNLQQLSPKIAGLLEQLSKSGNTYAEQGVFLGQAVSSLAQSVATLSDKVNELNRKIETLPPRVLTQTPAYTSRTITEPVDGHTESNGRKKRSQYEEPSDKKGFFQRVRRFFRK